MRKPSPARLGGFHKLKSTGAIGNLLWQRRMAECTACAEETTPRNIKVAAKMRLNLKAAPQAQRAGPLNVSPARKGWVNSIR